MAAKDLIRYDLLVQDALRGVVRKVLVDAARDGLAGDHHFYVSFRTDLPGVRLSQRLREKYPQDMTIVLQHQFWDLAVTEHTFEVGLSFSGIPERLLVPFEALTGFFDPSVQFGLKFEVQEAGANDGEAGAVAAPGSGSEPTVIEPRRARPAALPKPAAPKVLGKPEGEKPVAGSHEAMGPDAKSPERKAPGEKSTTGEEAEPAASAQVLSLDAFRKKT